MLPNSKIGDLLRRLVHLASKNTLDNRHEYKYGVRSPALHDLSDAVLVDRILQRPLLLANQRIQFGFSSPANKKNRVEIAARLLLAYQKAKQDENSSTMRNSADDMWTGILQKE